MTDFLGMKEPITAVVVGARGGVGAAFCRRFEREPGVRTIHGTSRDAQWSAEAGTGKLRKHCLDIVDEDSVRRLTEAIKAEGEAPNLVINCTGLLHGDGLGPERTWRELDIDTMRRVFDVNALGVALLVKHLVPLMPRAERSFFATLSSATVLPHSILLLPETEGAWSSTSRLHQAVEELREGLPFAL